jgi:hypothetical protein
MLYTDRRIRVEKKILRTESYLRQADPLAQTSAGSQKEFCATELSTRINTLGN